MKRFFLIVDIIGLAVLMGIVTWHDTFPACEESWIKYMTLKRTGIIK